MQQVTKLLKQLIEIESISGNELKISSFLSDLLQKKGFKVKKIPVAKNRFNILATVGNPKILLQAHMDTVPPYLEYKEDRTNIYGRGSCDTKSCIACMMVAAEQALEKKLTNFGLLFTVGEEVDFAGAIKAVEIIEKMEVFLIVGEPTELKPITSHYGILALDIIFTGKKAHSSKPNLGENAINKLTNFLAVKLPQLDLHPSSLMSVVKINGGTAANVIPDHAQATLSFRIAPQDEHHYPALLKKLLGTQGKLENVKSLPAVSAKIPHNLRFLGKGNQVKYCTELNFFKNGLVFGPSSIDTHGQARGTFRLCLKDSA